MNLLDNARGQMLFFRPPVNWTESLYERLPCNTTEKDLRTLTALMEHRGIPHTPLRPWGAQAEHDTEAWVRRMHLVRSAEAARHFDAIGAGGLAARVYGDAATAEKQKVVTDWLSWLFVFDDQVDEGNVGQRPERLATLLDVMLLATDAAPPVANLPLATALADLWRRIQPRMPQAWCHRFLQHVAEYFHGAHWEAKNRAAGRVPTPVEYPAMRRTAGAMMPTFDLIEFVHDLDLPVQLRVHPLYLDLVTTAADVVCWTDDLVTVEKEMARGDVHNLVIVLAHYENCSVEAASRRVHGMLTERVDAFLDAERRLFDSFDAFGFSRTQRAQAERWVHGLRTWMRGHLDWGTETPRYQKPEIVNAAFPPSYLEDLLPIRDTN
jgi:hypothetical protein